jgi:hypothetical protein
VTAAGAANGFENDIATLTACKLHYLFCLVNFLAPASLML